MIYNIYIIYHIIEFWIVFEQLAHTKCTNAQMHNFDICMCIAVAKEAGYEYVNADELREAKNDVIVEL